MLLKVTMFYSIFFSVWIEMIYLLLYGNCRNLIFLHFPKVCLFKGIDHFKKNIPNCECYVIKDGGHMMFETYLEETSKAINEWLSCHGNQLMTSQ